MKKILLAEDNETLGYILKEYLEMKGFNIHWAKDGKKAWKDFMERPFDLCILDVMMPGTDGFTLAEKIKTENQAMPIIFLTAKSLKVDVLKGFNLGADDYIKKPVDEEELVARINAVLSRSQTVDATPNAVIYEIGNYTFDQKNQKLSIKEEDRYLTERESKLLLMLCKNKGNLTDRATALKDIWGKNDYFNRKSMDVFISRLRKYMAADPRIKIVNVHGSGFILRDE
jgi:DNA-binding response OmpR family regulator